jgi:hypothetical protein
LGETGIAIGVTGCHIVATPAYENARKRREGLIATLE